MLDSTLRQKFLYNTPFTNDEMPYVLLDEVSSGAKQINLSHLCVLEESAFIKLAIEARSTNTNEIVLVNDLTLFSNNLIIVRALKCYLLSFAYHFKKLGFKVNVRI